MPILIALIGIIGGAYFWMNRAQNAVHIAGDLADAAQNAMGAARRFGFRRQANRHPVECIDDKNLAIGSLILAFFGLSALPTEQQKTAMLVAIQTNLNLSLAQAEEILVLGHWFTLECNGPSPAVTRLSRKAWKLAGAQGIEPTLGIIQDVLTATDAEPSDRQQDALHDIKQAFRMG